MTVPFAIILINPFAVLLPVSSMFIFAVRSIDFRSVVTTVAPLVLNHVFGGKTAAEFEDEFDSDFDDRFVAEFAVRPVAAVLTFV